jgi:hypothetical protein
MSTKNYVPIRERLAKKDSDRKKKESLTFSDMLIDLKRNPMIAIGLGGSALLTSLMGLFIGINPQLDAGGNLSLFGGVYGWGAQIMGILFGVLYAITFPIIGEWASYYWYRKGALRDENNVKQAITSYTMLTVAFGFMITTAVAASYILASLLHTFEAFYVIPVWAQKWTILIIPIALALHAGSNMYYDHVSEYARERRELERGLQTAQLEAENRMREARINAKKDMANAMAEEYEGLAAQNAVKAGGRLARQAWRQDERTFSGDHDGDGIPNVADSDYLDDRVPVPVRNPNGNENAVNSPTRPPR